MDEREAEERAEQGPPPEQLEPAEEATASTVDSTRDAGESETEPMIATPAAEEQPVESPVVIAGEPNLPAAETSEAEAQPDLMHEAADESLAESVAEPEMAEAETAAPDTLEATAPAAPAQTPAQEHRAAAAEGLRRGRLQQGDVPVDGSTEPAWYVIHCYSGYENKVRHNLEQRIETMGMKDRIFDVVIPTQEEIEVREGKRRTVERHIFPGYVLVNMTLSEESWYVVRNTPGVTGFVGMGNLPTPLRPEEVSQIIKRMESEAPAVKVSFKSGERVRIIDGPFNDFRGTVADLDVEHSKVRVMVSFFGRETPVELDFLQVERA
jgi:transcriptional antiterminator NusG